MKKERRRRRRRRRAEHEKLTEISSNLVHNKTQAPKINGQNPATKEVTTPNQKIGNGLVSQLCCRKSRLNGSLSAGNAEKQGTQRNIWMQHLCLQLEASCLQWSFFTYN